MVRLTYKVIHITFIIHLTFHINCKYYVLGNMCPQKIVSFSKNKEFKYDFFVVVNVVSVTLKFIKQFNDSII